jgi:redox-sensing transcriptional repressor
VAQVRKRAAATPRQLLCAGLSTIFDDLKKGFRAEIPRKAVYRLSVYFRCLQRLKANGIHTVSSEALAKAAGVKPTQLRKDLTYFGQFGTRGLGYDVEQLADMISEVLGTTSLQPVVLVGVGNLGLALLSYRGFEKEGFEIIAAFDVNPARHRAKNSSVAIHPMEMLAQFVREQSVKMAIIAVPASAAQEVTNALVQCGITGILNFAPLVLDVPETVVVNNVNLAIELENLSFFVQH